MSEVIITKNENGYSITFQFMKKVVIIEDDEYIPYKMIKYVYKRDDLYIHLHGEDKHREYNMSTTDCERILTTLKKYIKNYWSSTEDNKESNNMIQLGKQ